jgi:hypothetical protein
VPNAIFEESRTQIPDPGSGSATRTGDIWFSCSLCTVKWFDICRSRSTKETKQLWFYLLDENWTLLWSSRRIWIQPTGKLFLKCKSYWHPCITYIVPLSSSFLQNLFVSMLQNNFFSDALPISKNIYEFPSVNATLQQCCLLYNRVYW